MPQRLPAINDILPQELYEKIIDLIRDDHVTLRACAISGRVFTQRCQKWLFSRVVFRGPRKPLYLPNIGGSASSLEDLIKRSPHLATYIECLVIFDQPRWNWIIEQMFDHLPDKHEDFCKQDWLSRDKVLPRVLPTLMAAATNLKALVLQVRPDIRLKISTVQAILDLMCSPRIEYVLAGGATSTLVQHGIGSGLKHLSIFWGSDMDVFRPQSFVLQSPFQPAILESLGLYYGHSNHHAVEDWLLEPNDPRVDISHLRKLSYTPTNLETHERGWKLLTMCAATIEEFTIYPSLQVHWENGTPALPGYVEPIDLSRLQNLRKLDIYIPHSRAILEDGSCVFWDMFPWIASLLRCQNPLIPKTNLRELTIKVEYSFDDEAKDILHWASVVEVLLNGTFPGLRRLCIRVAAYATDEESAEIFDALRNAPFFHPLRAKHGFELIILEESPYTPPNRGIGPNLSWQEVDGCRVE